MLYRGALSKYLLWVPSAWLLSPEYAEESVGPTRCLAIPDMHTHHIGSGEGTADIPFGLCNDDIHLGSEHAPQGNCHTQAHGKASCNDLVVAPKVYRYKGKPNDARCIHSEGNILGFIEIGRHVASFESIVSATHDEKSIVAHWGNHT